MFTAFTSYCGKFSAFHIKDLASETSGGIDLSDLALTMFTADALVVGRIAHVIFLVCVR